MVINSNWLIDINKLMGIDHDNHHLDWVERYVAAIKLRYWIILVHLYLYFVDFMVVDFSEF